METFKIEKRYSNDILIEGEAESFKEFVIKNKLNLRGSNLRGSNLRDSDLSGSDLRGSNLSDADLSDADLSDSDLSDSDLSYCKIKASQKERLLEALHIIIEED